MKAYTVHFSPEEAKGPEHAAFVKDGIAWPALFIPPIWLVWHRLWAGLAVYVLLGLNLFLLGRAVDDGPLFWVGLLVAILFAMEANNIRRGALDRRGWEQVGGSFGRNLVEAEIRYFHGLSGGAAPFLGMQLDRAGRESDWRGPRRDGDEEIFGLFPRAEA